LPPVNIVYSHDIVFTQIAADLNLDQLERDLSRIGEPMNFPDRDIHRYVLVDDANIFAKSDLCGPSDDYPMLRAVKVLLQ
jgi:hypothetical protein